jgi:cysteine desulfurase
VTGVRETAASTNPIYFDHHATTPVDSRVIDVMTRYFRDSFGNASSVGHSFGDAAYAAVERARSQVASLIGARARDITFTAGATEAINLVLGGRACVGDRPLRIGLTQIEHPAVGETVRALVHRGLATATRLRVDSQGRVDLDAFRERCAMGLDIVCVILAHNEIGTIQDIDAISDIAREGSVELLIDASQAVGHIPVDATKIGQGFVVASAHKLYGPKGIGILAQNSTEPLEPILFGGHQERGIRPGTLAVPLIAGFGAACSLRQTEMGADEARIALLRNRLEERLATEIGGVTVNGDTSRRLSGNLHVSIEGVRNSLLQARAGDRVAFSTGSACASGSDSPSRTLYELGWSEQRVRSAIRFGVGKFNTNGEVEIVADIIRDEVRSIRADLS